MFEKRFGMFPGFDTVFSFIQKIYAFFTIFNYILLSFLVIKKYMYLASFSVLAKISLSLQLLFNYHYIIDFFLKIYFPLL